MELSWLDKRGYLKWNAYYGMHSDLGQTSRWISWCETEYLLNILGTLDLQAMSQNWPHSFRNGIIKLAGFRILSVNFALMRPFVSPFSGYAKHILHSLKTFEATPIPWAHRIINYTGWGPHVTSFDLVSFFEWKFVFGSAAASSYSES